MGRSFSNLAIIFNGISVLFLAGALFAQVEVNRNLLEVNRNLLDRVGRLESELVTERWRGEMRESVLWGGFVQNETDIEALRVRLKALEKRVE